MRNHPCRQAEIATTTNRIQLVVAVALIDTDGRVLITQRREDKEFPGFWEFPGGKIEANETPETALLRELKEELNIKTSLGCLTPLSFSSHSYPDFHLLMPFYICRIWQGQIHNIAQGSEGQNMKWAFANKLHKYNLLPADKPLIAILQSWL